MKLHKKQFLLVLPFLLMSALPVYAGVVTAVTRDVIEETLMLAEKKSGRKIVGQAARSEANDTLVRIVKTSGSEVLGVIDDGGLELIEAIPKYGDEVITLASKASPLARRAFSQNIEELLPLVRRVGVDAIELEAKVPGMAQKVFTIFGDDGARLLIKNVPAEDIPRMLKYADKADQPETRQLLLETYSKEGKSIFERIPAGLVLSTGLTASMLYGTHRATDPAVALGDSIRNNPDVAKSVIPYFIGLGSLIILLIVFLLLWRFGLMPWQRKGAHDQTEK
jgi:hypothetical protein